jgi:exonuclease 3'-5' domain-containing protein 1
MTTVPAFESKKPFSSCFIDTRHDLALLLDGLANLPTNPPSLYIDLEGISLSRHGSISIIQIFVLSLNTVALIDIHILSEAAFSTAGLGPNAYRLTLQKILEDEAIPKVFFDVRNDSDALFHHYNIKLAGVQDLQLMEVATRSYTGKCLNGLAKCLERDINMTTAAKQRSKIIKEKGLSLFLPERGGSCEAFNNRPLSQDIKLYCIQDVQYLPLLWSNYSKTIGASLRTKVKIASKERTALSQSKDYNPQGSNKKFVPKGW